MPPGIVVLKYKWTRAGSSGGGAAPFSVNTGVGEDGLVLPNSTPFPTGQRRKIYLYSMAIRYSGSKVIKAVTWDYIFDEPGSKREMSRQSFGSFEKIATNTRKTLQVRSPSSPARVVTADGLAKDERSPFDERVAIMCLLYKDGTVWEHPEARGTACEIMRRWLIRRGKLKA
jgi:hypothetical protein